VNDQRLYDRLVAKVAKDAATGCWNWTGPRWHKRPHPGNRYGYIGMWNTETKTGRAIQCHRAMMIALFGPLTPQQCVCHRCDNVLCVNPTHLFIGSMKDNIMDSRSKGRHYESRQDHCHRGHPLSGDNVQIRKQSKAKGGLGRVCRTCERARHRIKAGWPEDLAYSLPQGAKRPPSSGTEP